MTADTRRLSIEEYAEFCSTNDICPAFAPEIVEYYFSALGRHPTIVGVRDKHGQLLTAFPSLFRLVFPSPLHRRLLGKEVAKLGDFGQPEVLIPVSEKARNVPLWHISPTTSPLLTGRLRNAPWMKSPRDVAIAKYRSHKKLSSRAKIFQSDGGSAHLASEIGANEFAEIYIRLHCERWGASIAEYRPVARQIAALFRHVHGVVLIQRGEPVAAQFCLKWTGAKLHYVDFINSGVKKGSDNKSSIGSIMMLRSLRQAEEDARSQNKELRYSFGYMYGGAGYKAVWADAEPTFVAF